MSASFPIDSLVGLSESELLTIRSNLVSALVSGTPGSEVTSVSTRDLSTTFALGVRPEIMLQAVHYALWKLDPDVYEQPSTTKVNRYYTL